MLFILKLKVKVDVVVVLPAFGNEVPQQQQLFAGILLLATNPRQDTL